MSFLNRLKNLFGGKQHTEASPRGGMFDQDRAFTEIESRNYTEALNYLHPGQKQVDVEVYLMQAICHYQIGNIHGALAAARKATETDLTCADAFHLLGSMLLQLDWPDENKALNKALQLKMKPNRSLNERQSKLSDHISMLAHYLKPTELREMVKRAKEGSPQEEISEFKKQLHPSGITVIFTQEEVAGTNLYLYHLSCSWHRLHRVAGHEIEWALPIARQFFGKKKPIVKTDNPLEMVAKRLSQSDSIFAFIKNDIVHFICKEERSQEFLDLAEKGDFQPENTDQQQRKRITNWNALLSAVNNTADQKDRLELREAFPYQILFIGIEASKMNTSNYFADIPFESPSEDVVKKAREYAENPKLPGMLGMLGAPGSDYTAYSETDIRRSSEVGVDSLIVSVAECLKGKGTLTTPDQVALAAFEAIEHYSSLPVVRYFCALPALEDANTSGNMIMSDVKISIYKVVEGLLIELYDEISEGELITDTKVIQKVIGFFTS